MVKKFTVDIKNASWQQIRNILKNELYIDIASTILLNPDLPTKIMEEIMSGELKPAARSAKYFLLQNPSLPDTIIENVINGMYVKDPEYGHYYEGLSLNKSLQKKHLDSIVRNGSFDVHNKLIETGNPNLTREHISLMFDKSKSYQMCRNLSLIALSQPELVETRIIEEIFHTFGKLLFTTTDYTSTNIYFVNIPSYRNEIISFMRVCILMKLNVAAYTAMLNKVEDVVLRKILLRQIRNHPKYTNFPNEWLDSMFPYVKPENIT